MRLFSIFTKTWWREKLRGWAEHFSSCDEYKRKVDRLKVILDEETNENTNLLAEIRDLRKLKEELQKEKAEAERLLKETEAQNRELMQRFDKAAKLFNPDTLFEIEPEDDKLGLEGL